MLEHLRLHFNNEEASDEQVRLRPSPCSCPGAWHRLYCQPSSCRLHPVASYRSQLPLQTQALS